MSQYPVNLLASAAIVAVCAMAASPPLNAGEHDVDRERCACDYDPHQQRFTNDNAPDAILYLHFLESLYIARQTGDGSWRRYLAPGLTESSQPDALLDTFVDRYFAVQAEIQATKQQVVSCGEPSGRPVGADAATLQEALRHIEIAVYAKHLAVAAAELGIGQRFDLVEAVRHSPSAFAINMTYSAASVGEQVTTEDTIDALCQSLEAPFRHDVDSGETADIDPRR